MIIVLAKYYGPTNHRGARFRLIEVGGIGDKEKPKWVNYSFQDGIRGVIREFYSLDKSAIISVKDIPGRNEQCVIVRGEE